MLPMNVLIVDDDLDVLRLVTYLMEARGWSVRSVTSAEDALVELASARPDLLLLDLSLPRRDGIGLLKLLDRGLGRPGQVILISALPEQAVRGLARRHDLPYLTKPFGLADLDRVLAESRRRVETGSGDQG
jgi:DNA-binding response OmpR family regulator